MEVAAGSNSKTVLNTTKGLNIFKFWLKKARKIYYRREVVQNYPLQRCRKAWSKPVNQTLIINLIIFLPFDLKTSPLTSIQFLNPGSRAYEGPCWTVHQSVAGIPLSQNTLLKKHQSTQDKSWFFFFLLFWLHGLQSITFCINFL